MIAGEGSDPADAPADDCWRALCLLAQRVRRSTAPVGSCWLRLGPAPEVGLDDGGPPAGDGWRVSILLDGDGDAGDACGRPAPLPAPTSGESRYRLTDLIALQPVTKGDLPPPAAAILELYAPYCLAPVHARRVGRPFTVSHFAQSLDGRIAADGGDSKWIGCADNLLHAHRMRALSDGILIGTHTLRSDRPALTVRHAIGPDPTRIVVGAATDADLDCLLAAGPGRILVIGDGDAGADADRSASPQVERLALPREDGRISTAAILRELYRRDLLSVYVEGGAATTSAFLADRTIDVLQLHLSPMIIGPGVSSFTPPAIHSVADAVRFTAHFYRPVGDGMMFVGRVAA